ncbi:MAG TPA: PAS domain S-box protein [Leptospiraceae bacterium]|nr:PAS domain S-box protein [Leptospiraceae bacterium]HMW04036.1 PAS domain S-box protein [Leptospiraceae bacterium]HMX30926.1 PAS domain S-box protein [Leptospiraceae bacterium]HMY30030.1 PAS domain S-box protein [Leptospiraceae bacterium]HMZ62783.1 PAS domain S-box protein [Leptospiraceae bacterium]
MYAFDKDGKCILLNKNLAELFQTNLNEAIGKKREELILDNNTKIHRNNDLQIFESGISMQFQEEISFPDGIHTFLTEKFPLYDEVGEIYAVAGISSDITKQKKVEKEIFEKHQLLEAIFQSAPMAVLCLDREGFVTMWTPSAEKMFGWREKDILGKKNPIIPTEKLEEFEVAHSYIIEGNSLLGREIKRQKSDGSLLDIFISVSPLKDVNGYILGAIAICNDISNKKILENALKESEKKLRSVFDVLDVGITITDKEGNIIDCNKASEKILGITKEEHLTRNYAGKEWTIVRPDLTPMPTEEFASVRALRENRQVANVEMGVLKPNNDISWILVNATPMENTNLGVAISYIDITDLRKTEKELSKNLIEQNIILDNSNIGIAKTIDRKIIWANKQMCEMFQYTPSEILNLPTKSLYESEMDFEKLGKIGYDILKTGNTFTTEERMIRKDKSSIIIRLIGKAIHPNDLSKGSIWILYDITEEIKAKLTLVESEKKLKELNTAKDRFFSIVAHDLRSPIASLLTSLDLLTDPESDFSIEETHEFLLKLKESSETTYSLLENLLQWAKSQKGEIKFNPEENSLNDLINENIKLFSNLSKSRGIHLSSQLEKNHFCFFDKNLIDTVLRNLINNALKYTKENDSVLISAIEKDNKVIISVKDTGTGMNENTLESLFRIDVKHHSQEGTRGEKGSGLGLILCKEFIEKHNEKIWAYSELGKGSEFLFTVPIVFR